MNIHFTPPNSFTLSDFDDDDFNITGDKPVYQLTALATFVLSLARCTLFWQPVVKMTINFAD